LDKIGQNWTKLDKIGQNWTKLDKIGQNWSSSRPKRTFIKSIPGGLAVREVVDVAVVALQRRAALGPGLQVQDSDGMIKRAQRVAGATCEKLVINEVIKVKKFI
jgi:hypothetical protein